MRWLFVSRIDELVPGRLVRGSAVFPPELELFQDHFPRFPVVPGVLQLETLAQLAGKGIGYTVRIQRGDWPFPILSMMQGVKFRRFVKPNEQLDLLAEFDQIRDDSAIVKVKASVNGKVTAQAEQVFVFNAMPIEAEEDRVFLEKTEAGELKRLWSGFDPVAWGIPA